MSSENPSEKSATFINIDELRSLQPITVERLFQFHSVSMPQVTESGKELRIACPFSHCGKQAATGPKAISIQQESRGFIFKCFHYGCSKGGNDVAFNDLLRDTCGDGRPRGERFRENLNDYMQIAKGVKQRVVAVSDTSARHRSQVADDPKCNLPLSQSENEKARELVSLHDKFLIDQAKMPPAAASYERRRPHWFSDPAKILADWQIGFLPADTGSDRTGGTLRGRMVFPVRSLDGELLAWCGRDPEWEGKHASWLSLPEAKKGETPEPVKWKFPKNFHRGLELWGQERVVVRGSKKKLREQGGLFVCEGPGDVVRLDYGGILAVGLMGNVATREQGARIVELAQKYADGHVVVMLDLDSEGRKGMWALLQLIAPESYVRIGWTSTAENGKFNGRQPEELSPEELEGIKATVTGTPRERP